MGELTIDDSPIVYKNTLINFKRKICKTYNWTLHAVDETDICNLLDFIQFNPETDPNVKIIDGKEYHRASKPPEWL